MNIDKVKVRIRKDSFYICPRLPPTTLLPPLPRVAELTPSLAFPGFFPLAAILYLQRTEAVVGILHTNADMDPTKT
jgi:hypothetical protein